LAGEINERILPLLDDLIEPEGLVAAYEIRDGRVSWHIQAVSSVIAFLLTSARTAEARVVASEWFRGSSLDVQFPKLSERLRRDE